MTEFTELTEWVNVWANLSDGGNSSEVFAIFAGEGEAVDFGVVADVDGEAALEEDAGDLASGGKLGGEGEEFGGEPGAVGAGAGEMAGLGFDDEGGFLAWTQAEADEGAAGDAGMAVEDGFDAVGVEGAGVGFDALGGAATKPKAALWVAVAEVAEAVPNWRRGK